MPVKCRPAPVTTWGLEKASVETDHQGRTSLFTTLRSFKGLPDSSVGKESACNAGDPSSIPGSGRPAGEGIGYPLQYSGLENSIDFIVHGVAKSQT